MNNYIEGKIFGLPKPMRMGHNTSATSSRIDKEYIHRVVIKDCIYYKVHIARNHNKIYTSKIKYFKAFKEAKLFVDMLRVNKYL